MPVASKKQEILKCTQKKDSKIIVELAVLITDRSKNIALCLPTGALLNNLPVYQQIEELSIDEITGKNDGLVSIPIMIGTFCNGHGYIRISEHTGEIPKKFIYEGSDNVRCSTTNRRFVSTQTLACFGINSKNWIAKYPLFRIESTKEAAEASD